MIILDPPYASEFLINTIMENRYRVLRNGLSESIVGPEKSIIKPGPCLDFYLPRPGQIDFLSWKTF